MKNWPTTPGRSKRGLLSIALLGIAVVLTAGGATLALSVPSGSVTQTRKSGLDGLVTAKIAFADRKHGECQRLLKDLLAAQPDCLEGRILLGRDLLDQGRLRESLEQFSAVLKVAPQQLDATRGMASAYRAMGQYDLALVYHARACDLAPENPEVWKERGLAERDKGDPMAALSSLQHSLSLDNGQADLSSLLSELAVGKVDPTVARAPGASAFDSRNPRIIDPSSLIPRPPVPDPAQHFPRPRGMAR